MHPSEISINDYHYELPESRIASFPLAERDESKLLVYKQCEISGSQFKFLPDLLPAKSVLVFNNTKVIHARLNFITNDGHTVEVFCLGPVGNDSNPSVMNELKGYARWSCLVGNLKRWKQEELCLVKNEIKLVVKRVEREEDSFILEFSWKDKDLSFYEIIESFGHLPIPPYLKRNSTLNDSVRYQTIYASNHGSVAAPTAGLHFTPQVMEALKLKGINTIQLTLHVGAGTFKPVKSATLAGHTMHHEWLQVELETINELINSLNLPIVCVGTTSLRTIESLYWLGAKTKLNPDIELKELELSQWEVYDFGVKNLPPVECLQALIHWMNKNELKTLSCRTQIIIAPPYELKIATGLITNFHQPKSTLLLLVAAVAGKKWQSIYNFALENNYRFLSYGDSSLLLK